MRSLYFSLHPMWPLHSGGQLRDYQLAQHLAKHAELTFVEMCGADKRCEALPGDRGFSSVVTLTKEQTYSPSKVVKGLAGPLPLTVLNCWSSRSASRLADVMRSHRYDTVQLEGVHLIEYLPVFLDAPGSPAIVVDWHNIESEMMWRYSKTTRNWAKKIAARRTAQLIERAELRLLESCATHTVTSERERQKLLARCPAADIDVIPNGVDAGYYSPEKIAQIGARRGHLHAKPTILFVGSMDYHANIDAVVWFSRDVWPAIAKKHPNLHFTIVGRNPAASVCALASDRIHVTGTVDDVRPFYRSAVASVVPLRSGSGTRLKILEAMAAGVPVISSRLGAEGIEAADGIHWLLADSSRELAAAVDRVVCSAETRSRLSESARGLVGTVYDWSVIAKKLTALHEDLAGSRPLRSLRKVS